MAQATDISQEIAPLDKMSEPKPKKKKRKTVSEPPSQPSDFDFEQAQRTWEAQQAELRELYNQFYAKFGFYPNFGNDTQT